MKSRVGGDCPTVCIAAAYASSIRRGSVAGRIHNARNRWIRVVNVVIATAELAQLSEAADRAVFGPLRDAELKADQRAARRSAGDTPAEAETTPAEG